MYTRKLQYSGYTLLASTPDPRAPPHSLAFPLNVASIVRFVILSAPVSPRGNSEHHNACPYPPCSTFDGVSLAPSTGWRSSAGTYSRFPDPT